MAISQTICCNFRNLVVNIVGGRFIISGDHFEFIGDRLNLIHYLAGIIICSYVFSSFQ